MFKPGGDHGNPDLVVHVFVDHGAEDEINIGVRRLTNDGGCLIDLVQAEVRAAGNVKQDPARAIDADIEQMAG